MCRCVACSVSVCFLDLCVSAPLPLPWLCISISFLSNDSESKSLRFYTFCFLVSASCVFLHTLCVVLYCAFAKTHFHHGSISSFAESTIFNWADHAILSRMPFSAAANGSIFVYIRMGFRLSLCGLLIIIISLVNFAATIRKSQHAREIITSHARNKQPHSCRNSLWILAL